MLTRFYRNEQRARPLRCLTAFLVVLGFLGTATAQTHDTYDVTYYPNQGGWTGGSDKSTTDTANANAAYDASRGVMRAYARAVGALESAWAKAWVERDFLYDHHNMVNEFTIEYELKGELAVTLNGSNLVYVSAELWDITGSHSRLLSRTGVEYEDYTCIVNRGGLSIAFSQRLVEDHRYRVRVIGFVGGDGAAGGGVGEGDFFTESLDNYKFRTKSITVKHRHVWTHCELGDRAAYECQQEFHLEQTEYDEAEKLTFTNYTELGDRIEGWWIRFSDMNSASTVRVDDRHGDTAAWVTTAPAIRNGSDVVAEIWHWFDDTQSCTNCVAVEDVNWHETAKAGGQKRQAQAIPNHRWSIQDPVAVVGQPGMYSHLFSIWNDDPVQPLNIQSLVFKTSSEYTPPVEVDFGDASPIDISLGLGAPPLTVELITDGLSTNGYIFFSYNLLTAGGDSTICRSWGRHSVGSGREAQVEDSVPQARLIDVHPNPFNPLTEIAFDVVKDGHVRVEVYTLTGRHVDTLLSQTLPAGHYTRTWDGCDDRGRPVASGTYLLRVLTGDWSGSVKATLVR